MSFEQNLIQTIVVLFGLMVFAMGLRALGLVKSEHSSLFAKLVTEVTLPALIFLSLAKKPVPWKELILPLTMMSVELICLGLAWTIATLLRLPRPQKGAFILASGFSNGAFLGYVVVQRIFPDNVMALPDAVFTCEIGIGFMIFTLGVVIAIYYGTGTGNTGSQVAAEVLKFFRSPIFAALVLGLAASAFPGLSANPVMAAIFDFLGVLAHANTMLVILTIGLLFQVQRLGPVLHLVAIAALIKLILMPLMVFSLGLCYNYPVLWHKILLVESAMPSAMLSAIYSQRYGCDAGLATLIIFTTVILSAVTILAIMLAL
jgi:malate permease and related proteins